MASWTAPLPAAPSLSAALPAASRVAAPTAPPAAVIPASTIPYIQPVAAAGFTGTGAYAAPYAPAMPLRTALGAAGFLSLFAPVWSSALASAAATVGSLGAAVAIKSGGAVLTASFCGAGAWVRWDAQLSSEGTWSVGLGTSAALGAAFAGAGGTAGVQTLGAAAAGTGTLSGAAVASASLPAPPGGVGTLTLALVVNGAVVLTAGFSGTSTESDAATAHALLPAALAGSGTASALAGGPAGFAGLGVLAATLGQLAGWGSTGTAQGQVAFAASFGGESAAAFHIAPQALFYAAGVLSAVANGSAAETYVQSGSGTLVAAVAAPAAFSGVGALYPTEFVEWTASGSGAGSGAVEVLWSEQEAGAFSGGGTLEVSVLVSGDGAAWAWIFETADELGGVGVQDEAYGMWFTPPDLTGAQ